MYNKHFFISKILIKFEWFGMSFEYICTAREDEKKYSWISKKRQKLWSILSFIEWPFIM